ncbi:hypothetical protein [Kaarinaea lacus]
MVIAKNGGMQQKSNWMTSLQNVLIVVGWGLLCVITINHVVVGILDLPFTPDSWTYWELSKTVFSDDFYRINGWRNFQSQQPYSASFPPLWPLLIAVSQAILNIGPVVMPIITGCLVLLTSLVIELVSRRFIYYRGVGAVAGCALFLHKHYVDQIETAGTIPLAVFLLSILALVWITQKGQVRAVLLGVLAGLLCLTRFDVLLFALVLGLILLTEPVWLRIARDGISAAGDNPQSEIGSKLYWAVTAYYIALFAILSPYILYSIIIFGKIWATDSSAVALSSVPVYVTDYYLQWPPTLFDEPAMWLNKVFQNFFSIFIKGKWIVTLFPVILAIFLIWKFPISALRGKESDHSSIIELRQHVASICFIALAYATTFVGYAVTGYGDKRYFSPNIMLDALGFAFAVCFLFVSYKTKRLQFSLITIVILGAAAVNGKAIIPDMRKIINGSILAERELEIPYDNLAACYQEMPAGKKMLVLGDNTEATRIAALTGMDVLMMPRNYSESNKETRDYFIKTHNVGAVYVFPENYNEVLDLKTCATIATFYYLE